ncbi:unnamed protein product [Lupinus luteus]|uniref:Fe2OG dioxygenase domain-containing protein n=1 Tax=Lupinus luteus TaxID=3873 RepID=A0AAV1WBV6_LUPLU
MGESLSGATLIHNPTPEVENDMMSIFDKHLLQNISELPKEFQWPAEQLVETSHESLNEPLIDLGVLKTGDEVAIAKAAELVRNACMKHGFFQVINHGVDLDLIKSAYEEMDTIFNLPMSQKLSVKKKEGSQEGYSGGHGDRFSSRLPWKEILTFINDYNKVSSDSQVLDYFVSNFGPQFQHTGLVFQKYCEALKEISHSVMELLAISLGVDRMHYKEFFDDGYLVMRVNSYPPCLDSAHTFGTGPHTDPTSLTFLHQDQVGGLEVFSDNKWLQVRPRPDAFVINIGDTFTALTNGIYKSCLHRVLVNKEVQRKSMSGFLDPRGDKVLRAPESLFSKDAPRKYPDFTWANFLEFTQKHHRAEANTLDVYFSWLASSKSAPADSTTEV